MSFLTDSPDLSDACFSSADLEYARQFLRSAITRHDGLWLKEPTGPLRTHWLASGIHDACYLIELARILSTLQTNVTAKSVQPLIQKFRALLRANSQQQFVETLTELQVACHLVERVSPLAIEPLVPEELLNASERPKSPDFAFRLPDADVFVEVTVIRFGLIDSWDKRTRNLTDYLAKTIQKRHLRRAIKLVFPSAASKTDLPKNLRRELVEELLRRESGEWTTNHFGEPANVKWAPFPHVQFDEASGVITDLNLVEETRRELGLKPGEIAATFGSIQTPAVGTWAELVPNDSLRELLLKSIRNSLDQKRIQFPHDHAPYLLVVRPGHHRLIANPIKQLLVERIWPNQDYGWITGLCSFTPRTAFRNGDPPSSIHLNLNPHTRIAPTESLIQLFSGEQQFHINR
jgi:hypothetical protein